MMLGELIFQSYSLCLQSASFDGRTVEGEGWGPKYWKFGGFWEGARIQEGLGFRAGREQRREYTEQRQSFILLMKPC